MDCSPLGSSVHGIYQARSWSKLPFPYPRDLPDPGIELAFPALAGRFFTTAPPGKPTMLSANFSSAIQCYWQSPCYILDPQTLFISSEFSILLSVPRCSIFFFFQIPHISVMFLSLSCWVISNSSHPYGLKHARLPCPSLSSQSLLKLMSIESVMASSHLILCHPLLLLPSVFTSIRVFSSESTLCIRWPEYLSFSISLFSECSGLISFRIDWLDLPAVRGTFKSLLQHHSSKSSILWPSSFFMVQLSHPYMTIPMKGI